MKKCFMILALSLCMSVSSFGQSYSESVGKEFDSVVEKIFTIIKDDPENTVYGIVESNPDKYVVNTPIGKYNVTKNKNGSYTFLGIYVKLESKKGNTYIIDSYLGKFKIDLNKCTITKISYK